MPQYIQIENSIIELLGQLPDIEAVYLFGSSASGEMNHYSDVDVAILCTPGHVFDTMKRIQLQQDISDRIGRDCDLVLLNGAGPILTMQILKKGKLIYRKDSKVLNQFLITSITDYADFKKIREKMEDAMLRRRIYG